MKATQISVFLENRPGRLLQLLQTFAAAGVNLQALSVADTADFGIARVIVEDADAAVAALQAAGLTAATTDVLRVELPDEPGALANRVVEPLAAAGINVGYVYAYSQGTGDKAVVVLKTDDIERSVQVLAKL